MHTTINDTHGDTTAILECLQGQRRHVLGILDGLDDDALTRRVLPSGWTCAGLVSHLTLDVERFWFQSVMLGAPDLVDEQSHTGTSTWDVPPETSPRSILDRYRAEAQASDLVITGTSLHAAPQWWPPYWGAWRLADLRGVLLHVITETACHAGHLDAARELVDGKQWMVLD